MNMKPMTVTTSALLAFMITGPAWTADVVKDLAAEAVKQQATDAVKEQATGMMKDQAGTMRPKVGAEEAAKAAVTGETKVADPTKAVTGAAPLPGAAAVPAVDPTQATTDTAEDLAKKKAAEAAKGAVK